MAGAQGGGVLVGIRAELFRVEWRPMDNLPDLESSDWLALFQMLWGDYYLRWAVIAFIVLWGLSRFIRACRSR